MRKFLYKSELGPVKIYSDPLAFLNKRGNIRTCPLKFTNILIITT